MANPTPTNPGLVYDPRHASTASFFQALQAELDSAYKKAGVGREPSGPVPKPKDFQTPQPVPPEVYNGRPTTASFPNPNYSGPQAGFAVRV